MSKSRNIGSNLSFVSIQYAPSSKASPNANKCEKNHTPVIDIEALRAIRHIVEAINEKIAAGERNGLGIDRRSGCAGDSSGSTVISPDCGKNSNREEDR